MDVRACSQISSAGFSVYVIVGSGMRGAACESFKPKAAQVSSDLLSKLDNVDCGQCLTHLCWFDVYDLDRPDQ